MNITFEHCIWLGFGIFLIKESWNGYTSYQLKKEEIKNLKRYDYSHSKFLDYYSKNKQRVDIKLKQLEKNE